MVTNPRWPYAALVAALVAISLVLAWQRHGAVSTGTAPPGAAPGATTPPVAPPRPTPPRPAPTVPAHPPPAAQNAATALPPEALVTLGEIQRGGPYRYRQDGGVFANRERRLPDRPRGYYREYTVDTPGSRDRGARRIVTGGDPPTEYFYTGDHYRTFRRFDAEAATAGTRPRSSR
ncbi:MAG: hypothetical protein KA297_11185 [Kofleriaceae bacterium]|nr:hypothetical protein [Kofleriaceae bacterium]